MSKKMRLKPYNEVKNHHFITKERWDVLAASAELDVESFGDGLLGNTVLVSPSGCVRTFDNTFMVCKDDLYEVDTKTPKTTPKKGEAKTYTKSDIRKAGARVMMGIEGEEEAIASALAIAKLINELN